MSALWYKMFLFFLKKYTKSLVAAQIRISDAFFSYFKEEGIK
jgi:hypothetical protein